MEEAFADMNAVQISSNPYVETQSVQKRVERYAFVFVTAQIGLSYTAFEELKQIDGVKEVYLSHGAYDIIAKISGNSLEHLREIILRQIKALSSIKSTLTLTVI